MAWIPADHGNKGVHHQSEHEEHLENGQIELGYTKIFYSEPIQDPENLC